jgi:hypothetical protein
MGRRGHDYGNTCRPVRGMPAWKEVFADDQIENTYAYLLTVQAPSE